MTVKPKSYDTWRTLYDGGEAEVLVDRMTYTARRIDYSYADQDSYGDYIEGEVFVVFDANDRAFKMNGYIDSYGNVDWDGTVREVRKITKTIETWE